MCSHDTDTPFEIKVQEHNRVLTQVKKKLQLFKKEYNEHTSPFTFRTSNDGKLKTFFSHALLKMKKTNNKTEARPFAYRLQQLNRA